MKSKRKRKPKQPLDYFQAKKGNKAQSATEIYAMFSQVAAIKRVKG